MYDPLIENLSCLISLVLSNLKTLKGPFTIHSVEYRLIKFIDLSVFFIVSHVTEAITSPVLSKVAWFESWKIQRHVLLCKSHSLLVLSLDVDRKVSLWGLIVISVILYYSYSTNLNDLKMKIIFHYYEGTNT